MKLLILNQYAPPAPAPTSRLADELRAFLVHQGHTVRIVSERAEYRGHHARTGSRLLREIKALAVITWGALRAKPRPDVILALSSPPCLLVAAALVARVRRIALAHWAMDLYPDLAIALGELPAAGASKILRTLMRWAYHRCAIIVALDDDMAAHLKKVYGVETKIIPPWAAADLTSEVIPPPTQGTGATLAAQSWTWLYSGNLGRAHEWRPILLAQRVLEDRALPIQLLFEGGGAMWMDAQRFAGGLKLNCRWCDYADEAQSLQTVLVSSVVIVTQRREARGLLWPSKLARITPMQKPLIWIGPTDGAIVNGIRDRPDTACFEPEQVAEIAAWIAALHKTPQTSANLDAAAQTWKRQRVERCNQWELLLKNVASPRANTGGQ